MPRPPGILDALTTAARDRTDKKVYIKADDGSLEGCANGTAVAAMRPFGLEAREGQQPGPARDRGGVGQMTLLSPVRRSPQRSGSLFHAPDPVELLPSRRRSAKESDPR